MFVERDTCYVMNEPQLSPNWFKYRLGRIPGSEASVPAGRSPFSSPNREYALLNLGIKKKVFSEESIKAMSHGVEREDKIRESYAKNIKKSIDTIGLAIYKLDERFCSSLDGEYEDTGVEIKAPQKMYRELVEVCEAHSKGYTLPPGEPSFIYKSHYDQMTQNGIITDKKYMDYVVEDPKDQTLYSVKLPVNRDHWDSLLYPYGCIFLEEYIDPLMKIYNLKREPIQDSFG